MHNKNFAISGGGIAGLTLAIALQRKGFNVTVYEQAPEIKPLGAGLALASNAVKAFEEIGISEEILRAGKVIGKVSIKNQDGEVLTQTDAEYLSRKHNVVNNFTIHRGDLHKILQSHLQSETIKTGKQCIDFIENLDDVTIIFSDGTSAVHDYLIACDGIHSPIRKKLLPESSPRYSGYTCWRAVIHMPEGVNEFETSETWGRGKRFGVVPLANNELYWFACINAPRDSYQMTTAKVPDVLSFFSNFHEPIKTMIKATKNDELIWADIIDLKPLKHFAFGKIVLLGDAAHATTPNMGQGACMAIEDTVVLRNCLLTHEDPMEAFVAFEKKRISRTTKIVKTSWQIGKVAQLENPALTTVRNMLVKATPSSVAEKQLSFISNVSFD
jgi:2-polyprenyl-6-methoxyphenol hydroxylase-like FAD-dependent oxidoreductase